jgi:uncharacterized membrane protein YfcA
MFTESIVLFYSLLFVVAFLYAAVGHGGASGYLALMALFSIAPAVMKPTALLLNLFVSATAFIHFYRANYFKGKLFLPLVLASVPTSFIGGMLSLNGAIYKKILGLTLLIPVCRFLFFSNKNNQDLKAYNVTLCLIIGGAIGFLSGLIGIGGGIILSPVLLLLHWTDQKQTAAISALFIFCNSLAGLAGQLIKGITFTENMYWYVAIAFAGGIAGAYYGARRFSQQVLQYILGTVLIVAAYKLLFTKA